MMKRLLVLLIVLGMAFSIYPNSGLAADDVSAMYGDLNGDGSVNSIDYAIMKSYLIGIRSNFPVLNGEVVGDVNAENSVNSIDYAFIKSYLLGLISEFPAEKTRPLTTPAPQEEAIYEAEDAALYNSFLETIHSGFSGSGYVNYNNEYGSYVEWKVNVAKNGAYKLIFRYANGANTNRAMSISVNKKIARNSLDFNPTGSWTGWSESYIVVKLDQGDNLIRATAITADGGPNVDYLKVMSTNEPVMTPDPTTAQTPAPTPKNETPVPSSSTTIPAGAIIVDKSGRGNYTTVQAAVNSLGSKSSDAKTIYIKNGNYKEVVTIPNGISNLTIIGESKENVIIHYDNYNGKSNGSGGTYGTSGSASVFIKGSDITVHNITFMNSFEEKGNSN
ncbi:MAG TPA: pectinesterase family protein, partial [Acetivibrio clariflavus]|nr:pectinesterase family protein [Acetivibrio clariflavus]